MTEEREGRQGHLSKADKTKETKVFSSAQATIKVPWVHTNQQNYLCLCKTDAFKNNNTLYYNRTVLQPLSLTSLLSSHTRTLTSHNEDDTNNLEPRRDIWNLCPGLTHSVDSRLHGLSSRHQLVPQDSQPLMGQCLPNQQAGEFWENHSGRAGRATGFSMAWHLRPLFKITTHPIASHGRVHQGGQLCNVQCFENRTEIFPKAYNYGWLDANHKARLIWVVFKVNLHAQSWFMAQYCIVQ